MYKYNYFLHYFLCLVVLVSCKENSNDQDLEIDMTLINEIIHDMYSPNTGNGYPHGVPKSWDWCNGPIIRATSEVPTDWTAVISWGTIYRDLTDADDSNTRIELSNIRLCMLDKTTGEWIIKSNAQVEGILLTEDLDQVNHPAISANIRIEADGNPSGKILHGRTWHFFPKSRSSFTPANAGGWYVIYSAKLIVDDPNLPDDRSKSRYIMNAGADLWKSLSAPYPNNGDVAISRFKYITNEWTDIHMTTLSWEKLKANPPPAF